MEPSAVSVCINTKTHNNNMITVELFWQVIKIKIKVKRKSNNKNKKIC